MCNVLASTKQKRLDRKRAANGGEEEANGKQGDGAGTR